MPEQKSHISIAQGFEVQQPSKGKAYLIPILEWQNLKEKIERTDSPGFGFQTTGSILLGIAGTACVGALSMPRDLTMLGISSVHISWGFFLISSICGAMALYFASRQRKLVNYTKEDVLAEMGRIEKRFGRAEPS